MFGAWSALAIQLRDFFIQLMTKTEPAYLKVQPILSQVYRTLGLDHSSWRQLVLMTTYLWVCKQALRTNLRRRSFEFPLLRPSAASVGRFLTAALATEISKQTLSQVNATETFLVV